MDKNKLIQIYLNNILNSCENSNLYLNDKLIDLIIQQLPQNIIGEFNINDNNVSSFKNNEMKIPDYAQINYNGNNILFYYNDFELISAEIYEYLFWNFNDKGEKIECIFDDKYIIIKFSKINTEGKYLVEIGKFNQNKNFEIEFFILYDQLNYLYEHIENIINSGGFTNYLEAFKNMPECTLDIIGNNNIKYGIIIKNDIHFNQK